MQGLLNARTCRCSRSLALFLTKYRRAGIRFKINDCSCKILCESSNVVKGFDDYHEVTENTEIDFPTATVKFFKTTHTIPDSLAIVIKTSEGNIVYTGDFKFDQSAAVEYQTNFGRIADVGEDYVLALLSDSSDAESTVENVSDRKVAETMLETFLNAEGRIIVACVASNILRIQQVINAAYESGRKIFLTGSELEEIVNIALSLNKLTVPDKELIVNFNQMKKLADDELVILETGNAGEPIKSLAKDGAWTSPSSELTRRRLSVYRNNSISGNGNTNRSHKRLNLPCGCGSVRNGQ